MSVIPPLCPEQILQLIKDELNVKEVIFTDDPKDMEECICVNSSNPGKFFTIINGKVVYLK